MTKQNDKGHSIKIDKDVYLQTKQYCESNGLYLGKFIEKCVLAELERLKKETEEKKQ